MEIKDRFTCTRCLGALFRWFVASKARALGAAENAPRPFLKKSWGGDLNHLYSNLSQSFHLCWITETQCRDDKLPSAGTSPTVWECLLPMYHYLASSTSNGARGQVMRVRDNGLRSSNAKQRMRTSLPTFSFLVPVFVLMITTPRETNWLPLPWSTPRIWPEERREVDITHKLQGCANVNMCCHGYVTIYVFYLVRASTTVW